MAERRSQVLLLGGWTPGPLHWLRAEFADGCDFHEPRIPTPPVGCDWCCSPPVLLLVGWCVGIPRWVLPDAFDAIPVVIRLLLDLGIVCALVSWTVRWSVQRGVRIAEKVLCDREIDVVAGFSWGGGLCCWLLARGCSVPMLLLAPTQAAMAKLALMGVRQPMFAAGDEVAIFHATDDGFCPPSQIAALSLTGAEMHICDDAHVLSSFRSLQEISSTFSRLLQMARTRRTSSKSTSQ
ncbi:hypothetical protein AB1Y20_005477 [Prymnesium parvum]|uniref:Uncharacterized protein n=1 Tax=Prymnesium parvum TaxID=97485 RepID=A0AB34J4A3_PRYPA